MCIHLPIYMDTSSSQQPTGNSEKSCFVNFSHDNWFDKDYTNTTSLVFVEE